jgi:hypothetical protein
MAGPVLWISNWDCPAKGLLKILTEGAPEGTDPILFRAFMRPGPLRDAVVDWENAAPTAQRTNARPRRSRQKLLDEVVTYPGVPTDWNVPDLANPLPVMTVTFERIWGAKLLVHHGRVPWHSSRRDLAGTHHRKLFPGGRRNRSNY